MSNALDTLQEAVNSWHDRARKELEAEASFLELVQAGGDDIEISRYAVGDSYAGLIADTIAELLE